MSKKSMTSNGKKVWKAPESPKVMSASRTAGGTFNIRDQDLISYRTS